MTQRRPSAPNVSPSDQIGEVARLFVGERAVADWLPAEIVKAIVLISNRRTLWRESPSSAGLKRRLDAVADAAQMLAKRLDDASVLLALERAEPDQDSPAHGLPAVLHDLIQRSKAAAACIDPKAGHRRRIAPQFGTEEPEMVCARFVVETWRKCRGKPPGYRSRQAHKVCRDLWKITGGSKLAYSECGAGWERWFRKLATESRASDDIPSPS